jgi:hypothetical protein
MWSLAVIPANRLAPLGFAKAPKTQGTYGHSSTTTYEQLDLFAASLRTSKDTSALDCETSLQTWKALVTKRRGEYSARLKSARRTRESEFTFWPTPVAQDDNKSPEAHMAMKQRMKGGPRYKATSLQVMVKGVERGLWPTPRANDAEKRGNFDTTNPRNGLPAAAKQWPTPTASDSEGGPRQQDGKRGRALKDLPQQTWPTPTTQDSDKATKKMRRYHQNSLTAAAHTTWPTPSATDHKGGYQGGRIRNGKISKDRLDVAVQHTDNQSQSAGQLNPTWVEWLMGLPLGWTDLGSWGTE